MPRCGRGAGGAGSRRPVLGVGRSLAPASARTRCTACRPPRAVRTARARRCRSVVVAHDCTSVIGSGTEPRPTGTRRGTRAEGEQTEGGPPSRSVAAGLFAPRKAAYERTRTLRAGARLELVKKEAYSPSARPEATASLTLKEQLRHREAGEQAIARSIPLPYPSTRGPAGGGRGTRRGQADRARRRRRSCPEHGGGPQ